MSRVRDDLLSAYANLHNAVGKWPTALAAENHEWAPEPIDGLQDVHTKLKAKLNLLASLLGDVVYLTGRQKDYWEQYYDALGQLPRRHPVTEDRKLMADLVGKTGDFDGPDEMAEYLLSLGLTPNGPEWASWTVMPTRFAVFWEPIVPAPHPVTAGVAEPVPADIQSEPESAAEPQKLPEPEPTAEPQQIPTVAELLPRRRPQHDHDEQGDQIHD